MGDGVTVRRAEAMEYGTVGDLLEEAFTATFTITDWYRDNLHRVDEHARQADVWVAQVDGRLAGAVLTPAGETEEPDAFGFRLLGVAPWARGRGVAVALVAHAEALARARGFGRVAIWSGPQMVEAHRLYERLGYLRRPERETRVVDGGQRLRSYARELAGPPVG
jgi:GNAT superfamily N-acetyltransferase